MSTNFKPTFWNRKLKDARPLSFLNPAVAKNAYQRWFNQYYLKHILPGSFKPIVHAMLLVGTLGFAMETVGMRKYHMTWKNH